MSDQPLTDAERTLPPHLGGHEGTTWIDEPVLDYLIARYDVHSMLDVGCGPGGMIKVARERGLQAAGIDGDRSVAREGIALHDYTTGPFPWPLGWPTSIDLIWCVEFVEHVEAEFQENYLATFDAGRALFLTAAYPGQGGHHHVNEQPVAYWIRLLEGHNWALDNEATLWARSHGATPFAQMTGMVFTRMRTLDEGSAPALAP